MGVEIRNLLIENNIDFIEVDGDKNVPQAIFNILKENIYNLS